LKLNRRLIIGLIGLVGLIVTIASFSRYITKNIIGNERIEQAKPNTKLDNDIILDREPTKVSLEKNELPKSNKVLTDTNDVRKERNQNFNNQSILKSPENILYGYDREGNPVYDTNTPLYYDKNGIKKF
jgi:hypothetical protein